MQLNEQTQAILLLTAWLGKQDPAGVAPLTPAEWGRFARFLVDSGRTPVDLLRTAEEDALLAGFEDRKVTPERVRRLMERSAALGLALEKWQRAGLWVMTRSDADYPKRWKQRLKNDAPPVLFGAGNRDLLNRGGIAVVGSRDLDESQVAFTGQLGCDIAGQGQTVVSGGARGADEAAMLGALKAEGMAVGVLADSLLRASTSSRYRKALMSGDLTLVSPFNPEAGFNVGNAMARNKYIYCLSDAAIVIAATERKGGTWSGAVENLRQGWVPLWVRQGNASGNRALVEKGAHWLPDPFDVRLLAVGHAGAHEPVVAAHLDEEAVAYAAPPSADSGIRRVSTQDAEERPEAIAGEEIPSAGADVDMDKEWPSQESPCQVFLHRLGELLGEKALRLKELQAQTGIRQKQLSEWLKQAELEGIVVKTRSPVRYRLSAARDAGHNPPDTGGSGPKSVGRGEKELPQAGFDF